MNVLYSIPLLADIRRDWQQVRRFLVKVCLFCLILLILDHAIATFLTSGLSRYFGFDRTTDILCVGHSQTLLGINERELGDRLAVTATQYTLDGVNVIDRQTMIRQFLSHHPEVKLVVYDVESTLFAADKLSHNSYRRFFPFLNDPVIGDQIKAECTSQADLWLRRIVWCARFDEATLNRSFRGWLNARQNMKWGALDAGRVREWIRLGQVQSPSIDPDMKSAFLNTIDYLTSRNIKVLLWNAPIVDLLDEVDHDRRVAIRSSFERLASDNPLVSYVNYVELYSHRYDMFYDHMHMNAKGQTELTGQLASDIERLGLLK